MNDSMLEIILLEFLQFTPEDLFLIRSCWECYDFFFVVVWETYQDTMNGTEFPIFRCIVAFKIVKMFLSINGEDDFGKTRNFGEKLRGLRNKT
jgi:hypothetical protein